MCRPRRAARSARPRPAPGPACRPRSSCPVPFTPTTSSTAGRSPCGLVCRDRSMSAPTWVSISAFSSALISCGSVVPATLTWVRSSPTRSRAGLTPMSAVISVSSISSHVASSRRSRDSRPSSTPPNADWDLASRDRSRTSRPADGGGCSMAGGAVASAAIPGPAGAAACLRLGHGGPGGPASAAGRPQRRPRSRRPPRVLRARPDRAGAARALRRCRRRRPPRQLRQ